MTFRPHCLLPHPGAARVSVPARGEGFWTSLGLKSHRRSWSALKDDILTLRHWWETGRRSPAPMREDQSQKRKLSLNLADFQKLGDHGYGHRGGTDHIVPQRRSQQNSSREGTGRRLTFTALQQWANKKFDLPPSCCSKWWDHIGSFTIDVNVILRKNSQREKIW